MKSPIEKKRLLVATLAISVTWALACGASAASAAPRNRGNNSHSPGHLKYIAPTPTPTQQPTTIIVVSRTPRPRMTYGVVIPSANTPALSTAPAAVAPTPAATAPTPAAVVPTPAATAPTSVESKPSAAPKVNDIQTTAPAIRNVDSSLASSSRPTSGGSTALWIGLTALFTALLIALGVVLFIVRGMQATRVGEHVRRREFRLLSRFKQQARKNLDCAKVFVSPRRPHFGKSVVTE